MYIQRGSPPGLALTPRARLCIMPRVGRRRWLAVSGTCALAIACVSLWFLRASPSDFPGCLPPGMEVDLVESFDANTLADKIDGRAEMYLTTGFVGLRYARVRSIEDPALYFEVYDYDMETFRNAFSVLSRQLRPDSDAHEDDLGYDLLEEGSSFFVSGTHYLELVAGASLPAVAAAVRAWGDCYRAEHTSRADAIVEASRLPTGGRIPGSLTLLPVSAFGFHRLDGVVAARYQSGDRESMAFVSIRRNDSEAAELAAAFAAFLVENGGKESQSTRVPGARVVNVLDGWDVVFARGRVLAGVHDSPTLETAEALAEMLSRTAGEGGDDG